MSDTQIILRHETTRARTMMEEAISKRYQEEGPPSFYCPIGLELMSDPVVLVETGHTFDRANIEAHLAVSNRAPMCGTELQEKTLVTNHAMRNAIEEYLAQRAASLAESPRKTEMNEQPPPPASNKQPPPPSLPLPLPPADKAVTITVTRGRGGSVGMRFRHPKGSSSSPLEVICVEPGGPAEFSGLEAGDCFFAVDGVNISTMSQEELVALFDGKPGAKLELSMCTPPATKPLSASSAPQRLQQRKAVQPEQFTKNQSAVHQQSASAAHPHPLTGLASNPMMHHHKRPRQLQSAKAPMSTSTTLRDVLGAAIAQGARIYNSGDIKGCAALYSQAAANALGLPFASEDERMRLRAGLRGAAVSTSDKDAAWALREAFDDVLVGNTGMPRVYSVTSKHVHHPKQPQQPHSERASLHKNHFLQSPQHRSMPQHGQLAPLVPFAPQQAFGNGAGDRAGHSPHPFQSSMFPGGAVGTLPAGAQQNKRSVWDVAELQRVIGGDGVGSSMSPDMPGSMQMTKATLFAIGGTGCSGGMAPGMPDSIQMTNASQASFTPVHSGPGNEFLSRSSFAGMSFEETRTGMGGGGMDTFGAGGGMQLTERFKFCVQCGSQSNQQNFCTQCGARNYL